MKYRKKPVVVEAVQLCWANWSEMCDFLGDIISKGNPGRGSDMCSESCGEDSFIEITIPTLEGDHIARHGDFIIRGVQGEFYPCKPDIFRATYENDLHVPQSGDDGINKVWGVLEDDDE